MITVRVGADDGDGRRSYDVEVDHDVDRTVWWETQVGDPIAPDERMDVGAIALVPMAMNYGQDLRIDGPVSWSLLANLSDVIDAWSIWRPDRFQRIGIEAAEVVDDRGTGSGDLAGRTVMGFSGGVDSTFVTTAHAKGLLGRASCDVAAAVLVHGFDIPLDDVVGYRHALEGARAVTAELGVPFTAVRTNWRTVVDPAGWEISFGHALCATLHLFADRAGVATVASDNSYGTLASGWGTNPITTPLLSSDRMRVRYTAAGWTRTEKCRVIGELGAVREHLRVCWQGDVSGRNCGRCEKCVRTKMNLIAAGIGEVPALGALTDADLQGLSVPSKAAHGLYLELLEDADALGPHAAAALEDAVARSPFQDF